MQVSDYDYLLPEAAIAQSAIEPRDASRLLDTTTMRDLVFSDVGSLLDPGDAIVVNTTKVRAARLRGRRPTGGASEVLLLRRVDDERWEAMLRPAKKLPAGTVVECDGCSVTVLTDAVEGIATVTIDGSDQEAAIAAAGSLPLPPYFHGSLDTEDRYQTVFADRIGSAAAPTAALHFTDELVSALETQGIGFIDVELEVGLDTFRPMDDGDVAGHRIHTERIVVSEDAAERVNLVRQSGGRIVAVGTTVTRTLESATDDAGTVHAFDGPTDLFITPGYDFRCVDALITNFHAPRTTLLVLISAILGPRWRDVYETALERGYRFLSFGDAMWIEVNR